MKYFVIYQEYTEYNQFEGSWDTEYHSFDDLDKAKAFAASCEKSYSLRLLAGPLISLEEKQ